MKPTVAIVIYSNPDYLPPASNVIRLLSDRFNVVVISRNQDEIGVVYPANVEFMRLGRQGTALFKERQSKLSRIAEYVAFIIKTRNIVGRRRCSAVYGFDNHGFLAAFAAARICRNLGLIYHNLDIYSRRKYDFFSWLMEKLELWLLRFSCAAVFCNVKRKSYFQSKAVLPKQVFVVINAPLKVEVLPVNKLGEILNQRGFPENSKVVFYQGSLNKDHCILEVIRSIQYWPQDSVLVLCGLVFNEFKDELNAEIQNSRFRKRVIILPYLQYAGLKYYTVGASLGLALYNIDSGDLNLKSMAGASNKFFEYFAVGVPVLTNDSAGFGPLFDTDVVYYAQSSSAEDIGRLVSSVFGDVSEFSRRQLAVRQLHLEKFNYEIQFAPVLSFMESLYTRAKLDIEPCNIN